MEQFLREMHPDYYNFSEEVAMLAEIITDYVALVLVFDMEEDSDLDGYMISSLLASGKHYIKLRLKNTFFESRAEVLVHSATCAFTMA